MPSLRHQTSDVRRHRRKSGVVVPHRARWHQRLLAALIYFGLRGLAGTIRFKLDDPAGTLRTPREKMIYAIWHNRLALSGVLYQRYFLRSVPERRMAGLVSASRDGGLLARIMNHFGMEAVRGSSSRRGPQGLREMVSLAENGLDLAFTPDGPRGPCYIVQEGVISAGQLTGMPIVPTAYHLNWKIRLKSWDRFQIPLPFARCVFTLGQALRIPREASDAEREVLRRKLEAELRTITRD